MQINPLVEELGEYPFTELTAKRIALEKSGRTIINFGVGEPREPTPQFIRETLARAVLDEERSQYPSAAGMEQLRESIANWVERR
ncbi:MAG: succinyldiaminopimelate transaminase, partial [Actinobacteria bacterium]|nr:succinyldiaminopimelate transaminase [Actinomycetota bacterium]